MDIQTGRESNADIVLNSIPPPKFLGFTSDHSDTNLKDVRAQKLPTHRFFLKL